MWRVKARQVPHISSVPEGVTELENIVFDVHNAQIESSQDDSIIFIIVCGKTSKDHVVLARKISFKNG